MRNITIIAIHTIVYYQQKNEITPLDQIQSYPRILDKIHETSMTGISYKLFVLTNHRQSTRCNLLYQSENPLFEFDPIYYQAADFLKREK